MKLDDIYRSAVAVGIRNDPRGKDEVEKLLGEEKKKFDKLEGEEKTRFDRDRMFNPFSDTRILFGDPKSPIKKVITGIDMQVGEVLMAYLLNRDSKAKIDLIVSHHPEGTALAQLFEVMRLQADLLAHYGISISVAEQLMEKRIGEIERRLLPVNHSRTVDAARAMGLPMMCLHTPADNCVTSFLNRVFERKKPVRLKEVIDILLAIPEYKKAARDQVLPKIVSGSESSRCGKIYVDMTGGTSGSKDVFGQLASSGVSTIVGMHMSEDYLENAKKANLNVIIAGHISSDNLGLNLLFDEIEKKGRLDFVCVSGFERIRRPSKP